MNLSDMLSYADIGQLSKIAGAYRCECNGNSKNELIQSILSEISRHDVLENQISSMRLEDLRFLNSLLFESRQSYSLEDLVARVQQSRFGEVKQASTEEPAKKTKKSKKKPTLPPEPPSPRDIIVQFKHQGWLFNGFSGPGRYLFQVPNDLKSRFRETLRRKFAEQLHYTDEPPMYRDEQGLLQSDIKQLLHYVYHNEVQLVTDGSMYKRNLQQMLDRMGVQEELPSKGAWRFGYGRHFNHYPDRFSLMYDYCRSAGYISETADGWLSITDAGKERLEKPATAMEQVHLYRYWLKLYKTPVVNLLSLVHWIHALAADWVTIASLKDVFVPFIKTYYYDDAHAILEARLLKMMMHLGLLRIGEDPVHGTVVRMTKAGNAVLEGTVSGE
ncbi:hypothetical protein [Paenibacillus paeoniae]|uniref:Helicase XPB/Ssl2 N-terminal domain-containing protein n=1 Tax=Paenibacillus paeoniae TaxID=2292705 RepID=A0A371PM07_9BACL|nr:hypothetical protein [Paenibacillus paeoniae]REK77236.1 hypothetical protein DX130_09610 [Paenibacillus paeoniae]